MLELLDDLIRLVPQARVPGDRARALAYLEAARAALVGGTDRASPPTETAGNRARAGVEAAMGRYAARRRAELPVASPAPRSPEAPRAEVIALRIILAARPLKTEADQLTRAIVAALGPAGIYTLPAGRTPDGRAYASDQLGRWLLLSVAGERVWRRRADHVADDAGDGRPGVIGYTLELRSEAVEVALGEIRRAER